MEKKNQIQVQGSGYSFASGSWKEARSLLPADQEDHKVADRTLNSKVSASVSPPGLYTVITRRKLRQTSLFSTQSKSIEIKNHWSGDWALLFKTKTTQVF